MRDYHRCEEGVCLYNYKTLPDWWIRIGRRRTLIVNWPYTIIPYFKKWSKIFYCFSAYRPISPSRSVCSSSSNSISNCRNLSCHHLKLKMRWFQLWMTGWKKWLSVFPMRVWSPPANVNKSLLKTSPSCCRSNFYRCVSSRSRLSSNICESWCGWVITMRSSCWECE